MSSPDTSTPTHTEPSTTDKPTQDDASAPNQPAAASSSTTTTPSSSTSTSTATPTKPTSSTPKPAASRKPRCNFKSCNALAQRVVGDCGFCGGKFCGKHRLLESHACSGLEDCKDEARERNKERLETERTVVVRGV